MRVLLCGELGRTLDLSALAARLADSPGVAVQVTAEPCRRRGRWLTRELAARGPVVLGVCGQDGYREAEARARSLGLGPGAFRQVVLGKRSADPAQAPEATARAARRLRAALARAAAAPPPGPEHLKAVLATDGALSRRALFTLPPVRYVAVPSIRADACAVADGCDVCAVACPHGALATADAAVVLDRDRCTGCGVCVTACPRSAVDLPGGSPQEIEAEVAALLDGDPAEAPGGLLFHCEPGASSLGEDGTSDGWAPVEVPCLGFLTPALLFRALARGAAVALRPCEAERCRAGRRDLVTGRLDYCRAVLAALGARPDAVVLAEGPSPPLPRPAPRLAGPSPPRPAAASRAGSGRSVAGEPCPAGTAPPGTAAFLELAAAVGAPPDLRVEHPHSPFGLIRLAPGCTLCGACATACPAGALALESEPGGVLLRFDPRRCLACGACGPACPERVVQLDRVTDLGRLREGSRVLHRDSQPRCERCGGPVAPRTLLDRMRALLGTDPALTTITRYCTRCRGLLP